jgi:hypothetical protein
MSRRVLLSTTFLIINNCQALRAAQIFYRSSLVLGVAVLLNALIAPSVMAATLPSALAASKTRAQADAKALIGFSGSADSLGGAPQQPQQSATPNPIQSLAVASGNISSQQAEGIAKRTLNVALDRTAGNALLVRSGNVFTLDRSGGGSGISPAVAEQGLRQELTFQGYTSVQINAAIAILKGIGSSARQSVSTLTLPVSATGAIGLGANATLSLPTDNINAGTAAPLGQNAVAYNNTEASTDTVVQAVDARTVETYHIIRDKSAPEQYTYSFNNLPAGALLRQTDPQTVEAYFPQHTFGQGVHAYAAPETILATIKAPWAHDAAGTSVPIFLTIGANNTVILHVLHKNGNYLYPIVADPVAWWGWWGFMWWGSDWTIDHFSYALGGVAGVAALIASLGVGAIAYPVAGAIIAIITSIAGWCKGPNGATFYFYFQPWYPYVSFAYCKGW